MPAVSQRLDVFDGLRGIAITLVVWYHVWLVSGLQLGTLNLITEAGFLGVDLFFFISGFCLFLPYARAAAAGRDTRSVAYFLTRRAQKIIPSYLLALGVFALVYHDRFASAGDAALQLLSHLTFVHTLLPATFNGISGPLWTIGIEVQFYLVFPAIAPWFVRAPLRTYAALILIAQAYRIAAAATGNGSSFWLTDQLPAFLDLFGAGMLTAWLLTLLRDRTSAKTRSTATWAALAAFAVAIAGLVVTTLIGRADGADGMRSWVNAYRIAIGPVCIALGVSSTFAGDRWRRVVAARPLVFLSAISYNVYLWHLEITVWFHNAGLAPIPAMLLAIASAIAVAALVTYLIERPILAIEPERLRVRLPFSWLRPLPAGAATGSPSSGTSSPSRHAA
jgi:peptidoglycan/LPS O-acetylase OafA/YrhL